MPDQLEVFQQKLDELKKEKAQAEYRIQSDMEAATALKAKLTARGYASLEEAKQDYATKKANINLMSTQLDTLIEQIKQVPHIQPTKEQVLAELQAKVTKATPSVTPVEPVSDIVLKEQTKPAPEAPPAASFALKLEDEVKNNAPSPNNQQDMFSSIQNLL